MSLYEDWEVMVYDERKRKERKGGIAITTHLMCIAYLSLPSTSFFF